MLKQIGTQAKEAAAEIAVLSTDKKNQILQTMADELLKNSKKILDANKIDLKNSKDLDLTPALIDRLSLSEELINGMANGLLKIIPLEDPVGNVTKSWETDEGLHIKKIRSPFGVIGVIYEARPNVTSDVSGLCLKSGNAVVLRGSSYCLNSNIAILELLQNSLVLNNCNKNIFQILESKDRQDTIEFMHLTEFVDLIIPRGGKGLIQTLVDNSKVPFILDGDGNVHLYIHQDAKKEHIIDIVINSKVQRPGVCNALETLLINSEIYQDMGSLIIEELLKNEVELFVDEKIKRDFPKLKLANESHYETEFLDLKLAVKVVDSVNQAIEHIKVYSSGHTEAVLTESKEVADTFAKSIDSSVIFINSSTRFTDGEMFGFGSEIGISTQKLHVRGPMGLEALTNERYVVTGEGTVRG
jgi:glutamate-5-semialdehyde dehydrogenase